MGVHYGKWTRSCFVLAMAMAMTFPSTALAAMKGDLRYELYTDWRGVASKVWIYPWSVEAPDGHHVSSIYIRKRNDHRHVEAGVTLQYGWPDPKIFSQWNKSALYPPGDDRADWDYVLGPALTTSGYYVYFEVNNLDMGGPGDSGDRWRTAWNGNILDTEWLPFIAGDATCASERENVVDNYGDDNESSFRDLKKKNNSSSWSYWTNSAVYYDQDPYYHWGSYSASHWYDADPGRPK